MTAPWRVLFCDNLAENGNEAPTEHAEPAQVSTHKTDCNYMLSMAEPTQAAQPPSGLLQLLCSRHVVLSTMHNMLQACLLTSYIVAAHEVCASDLPTRGVSDTALQSCGAYKQLVTLRRLVCAKHTSSQFLFAARCNTSDVSRSRRTPQCVTAALVAGSCLASCCSGAGWHILPMNHQHTVYADPDCSDYQTAPGGTRRTAGGSINQYKPSSGAKAGSTSC